MCNNNTYVDLVPSANEYYTIEKQIALLQQRQLIIEDVSFASRILEENSYTSFIKYYSSWFLIDPTQDNSNYRSGASLNEIYALYTFNRKLSALYLEYILLVERMLKTVIADHVASVYGPTCYWEDECYSDWAKETGTYSENKSRLDSVRQKITEALQKKYDNDQSIKNTPFEKYSYPNDCKNIPIWLLVNILSLGTVRRFYNCLQKDDREKISSRFSLQIPAMENAFALLNAFRNCCAHDERVFNFYSKRAFVVSDQTSRQKYYGVYAITRILKHFLSAEHFIQFYTRLNEYLSELQSAIHTISIFDVKSDMQFPANEDLVFAEFGQYNDGVILSSEEFYNVINRYILPLIPQGRLEMLDKHHSEASWEKKKSQIMKYVSRERRLYFSQSNSSNYIIRTSSLPSPLSPVLLSTIETHLRELISNLQIVWNTQKARVLRTHEQENLFVTNTEIAYQLSICSLLAYQKTQTILTELHDERNRAENSIQSHRIIDKETKDDKRRAAKKNENSPIFSLERTQRETIYCILSRFDRWAQKTYEGKHMPFAVIVNRTIPNAETFDYVAFLAQNYSATISDGLFSCVEINADGSFCRHLSNTFSRNELFTVPYPHQGFAAECKDGKIGVLLTTEGDILIISEQKMVYSKHNGSWTHNQFELAYDIIHSRLTSVGEPQRTNFAQAILSSLIDVSYSHGGACLAIAGSTPPNTALLRMTYPTLLNPSDRLLVENAANVRDGVPLQENEKETDDFRMEVLRQLVGQNRLYPSLNAYLRRELLEMDGSLILGADGKILSVASIVNTNGASVMSGARTTAAVRLSAYGLAIKVSQDGYMKFYEHGEEILSI